MGNILLRLIQQIHGRDLVRVPLLLFYSCFNPKWIGHVTFTGFVCPQPYFGYTPCRFEWKSPVIHPSLKFKSDQIYSSSFPATLLECCAVNLEMSPSSIASVRAISSRLSQMGAPVILHCIRSKFVYHWPPIHEDKYNKMHTCTRSCLSVSCSDVEARPRYILTWQACTRFPDTDSKTDVVEQLWDSQFLLYFPSQNGSPSIANLLGWVFVASDQPPWWFF